MYIAIIWFVLGSAISQPEYSHHDNDQNYQANTIFELLLLWYFWVSREFKASFHYYKHHSCVDFQGLRGADISLPWDIV